MLWEIEIRPRGRDGERALGVEVGSVRSFRRYFGPAEVPQEVREALFRKVLANEAIEQVVLGPLTLDHLTVGSPYHFDKVTVALRELDDEALRKLSKEGQ